MHPLVISIVLHAAPALPPQLTEAIRAGEHHSHPLAISRATSDIGGAQADSALAAELPSLNFTGNYLRNQYNTVIQFSSGPGQPSQGITITPYNSLTATITLQSQLIDFAGWKRYSQAKQNHSATETKVEASRRDVQLAIAQVYYQVVAAQGTTTAAQRALDTAKKNEQVVGLRYQQGTAAKVAYDKAKVDTIAAEFTLTSAQRTLALVRRQLATLTGQAEPGELPEPQPAENTPLDEEALVKEAFAHRPELKAAQQSLDAADTGKTVAWATALPSLNGNATEHLANASGFVGRGAYWTAGLTLVWNVDPLLTSANIRAADGQQRIADQQLQAQAEGVRDDVHAAVLDVNTNRTRLEQATAAVENARETLQLAELRLNEGVATQLEVSEAQSDAFRAEAALAQAKSDYAYSLLEVQHSTGNLLVE